MVCFCEGTTPFNLSVQASDLERLSLIIKDFDVKAKHLTKQTFTRRCILVLETFTIPFSVMEACTAVP